MGNEKTTIQELLRHDSVKDNVVYLTEDLFMTDDISHIPPIEKQSQSDMTLFLICNEGQIRVVINGSEFQIKKNGILTCTGLHIVTQAMVSTDFKCSIIGISYQKLIELMPNNKETAKYISYIKDNPVIQLNEEETRLFLLYKEMFHIKRKNLQSHFETNIIDKLLHAAIYDLIIINTKTIVELFSQKRDVNLKGYSYGQKFLTLLAEDNCSHKRVDYYANLLCITTKHLSKVVREETGKTPKEWIREKIVGNIRHYLLNTNLSIKEISSILDFPNSSFFGKYTKQHLGMSPNEFRNKKLRD